MQNQEQAWSRDMFWGRIIAVISVVLVAAVAFLILGPRPAGTAGMLDVSALPLVNASLNAISTVLLLAGFVAVRRKRIAAHRTAMLSAFGTSALFLVSYVVYHWFKAGPRPYEGAWPAVYYTVLITHIVLAAFIVPLALFTLYRGTAGPVSKHRKIARWTLPLWLYVSVTGVVIYLML